MSFLSFSEPCRMHARRIRSIAVVPAICLAVLLATVAPGWAVEVKVATGAGHGALLKTDGTLWTWGANSFGRGTGRDEAWGPPAQMPGMTGVRDVACGDYFTIIAKDDGTVWAWGDNSYGKLGSSSMDPSTKPVQAAGLTGIVSVASGSDHSLALKSDGTVWAWGKSTMGCLGYEAQGSSATPKQVNGLTDAKMIAAGTRHSVALKTDGTVWVWGNHGVGNAGNGNNDWSAFPIRIDGLSNVVAIAAGDQLTLAVKKDGTLWVVGSGASGQLGDGSAKDYSIKPIQVSGLTGVKSTAAGSMHSLALKGDGTVWSWGDNNDGQLGNSIINSSAAADNARKSPKPVRSGSLTGVVAAATAFNHSVAVTGDGVMWAWGDNEYGALGTISNRLPRSEVPMKVGQYVPEKCEWLFNCETRSRKAIQICGDKELGDSSKWSNIQYRFGPVYGPPELVFPEDPPEGNPPLFFSHIQQKGEYRVSVRFSSGGYTYRVYSNSRGELEEGAGVKVSDRKGKVIADIACGERPEIFIDYLRNSLPCDRENPHGAAACEKVPYRVE